jgi:hypothetical protein
MIAGTVAAGAAVVGGAVGAGAAVVGAAVVGATVVGATVAATAVVSVAESEELPHAPVTKTRLPATAIAALARNFILNPLPRCSHRTGEASER